MIDFTVDLQSKCRCPKAWHAPVLKAAHAALCAIPSDVMRPYVKQRPSPCEIGIVLVSASIIHRLNKKYRKKDRPTDVLSFSDLEIKGMPRGPFIGEIFICWTVAQRQAEESGISVRREMEQLTVHGILHLFGYDHELDPTEARRMFRLQDKVLAGLRK